MKYTKTIFLCLLIAATNLHLAAKTNNPETTEQNETVKKKKSFGQKLLSPIKWIGNNWTAYDPKYSLPSFYNWAAQVQNTTSFEWLRMQTPEGIDLQMNAKISNRLGPYFGYQWLFYGYTIDLNSIGTPTKRKNEFTLSINSNLVNIDIIRRRTGGDFTISKLKFDDKAGQVIDLTDEANDYDMGEHIRNSITGFNINYFTNHLKYSNPAAFSNGAIQLRSVGTPILGLGYTHQKVESELPDLISSMAVDAITSSPNAIHDYDDYYDLNELEESNPAEYKKRFLQYMDDDWAVLQQIGGGSSRVQTFMTNHFPSTFTIDDFHFQVGYAYNLVFSRRLLLGLSVIASPGFKIVKADNNTSLTNKLADELSQLFKKNDNIDISPDEFRYNYKDTHFNLNLFARASLTYNFNRWRAGVNATFSNYFYNHDGMRISNGYGNLTAYIGYCFGRKKEYRYNGELRKDYIEAALTKRQIAEMKDTMPEGNIAPQTYTATKHSTRKYHKDAFTIDIFGCDLVKGPDGRYGWYEIEDGFITPGEDTEGHITPGTILEIDKNGEFSCDLGHNSSIRAGNWWKSQLGINQIPNHWYPELLHYALRGKLTLYVRGRVFGTKKPVKLEFDDFCINHGKETQSFFQMGIKSFQSHSAYSIEGKTEINGRPCRIYIEQKKRGKLTNMYVSRLYESNKNWMAQIDGNRPISLISMPGTHDAGTSTIPEQPAAIFRASHTQNFSVPAQLADGIRAFDIRLKKSLKYGHTVTCSESFDSTMVEWEHFLSEHPSEFIVAMIGSDEGGKWDSELTTNYSHLIDKYKHLFTENFSPSTPLDSVRGKILVIRRQETCPYGKLLNFENNAVFENNGFHVEDVYKEHKTYKKIKIVEQHIRDAYENEDPNLWYITFNSIAWSPRRHNPYSYAWGGRAKNIRKPMNKSLSDIIELKDYTDFGIVFLDFYNDHGDNPQIVETIIRSNFHHEDE